MREIEDFCLYGKKRDESCVFNNLEFEPLPSDQVNPIIDSLKGKPKPEELLPDVLMVIEKRGHRTNVLREALEKALTDPKGREDDFALNYASFFTTRLDGHNRIDLVKEKEAGELHAEPKNNLQFLFQNDGQRERVRNIVADAFNKYLAVDPTNLGKLRLRLAPRPPEDASEERGLDERAVQYHRSADLMADASDGVKAFTGILLELIAGDSETFLIDEPEAFLHPALSYKLGQQIATIANSGHKQLFVSTHSPHFVMGCVQSGVPVNIVRLTYRDNISTARLLAHDDVVEMMRNPLLRSANVLAGLFYESVVVTEADADRAFYQEINERMNGAQDDRGIPHCLFLNAQNKQTVHQIIQPLRKLGIPAAAVVDLDVIKEGGQVWSKFLAGAYIPRVTRHGLANNRDCIYSEIKVKGIDVKKEGVEGPEGELRESLQQMLAQLSKYGLFIVPVGELEKWLSHLQIEGGKPTWLVRMFEAMGDNPESGDYLRPGEGDVWGFVGGIKEWLFNPTRRGIPGE